MGRQKTVPSLGGLVSLFVLRTLEDGIGEDEVTSKFLWSIRLNGEADVGQLGNSHDGPNAQSQARDNIVNHSLTPSSTSDESMEERTRKLFFPYE
jgi:hypothetical protein